MFTFNDDIELLKLRVDRLKTDYAWAEIPPSRTRRFVSNVRVKDYVEGEKAVVKSYLLIYRSRSTDIQHDLISGNEMMNSFSKKVNGNFPNEYSLLINQR